MPVPTIDPQSSIPFWPQWQPWEHLFSASESPTSWTYNSGGLPTGMSFQPLTADVAGEADTEVITLAAHGFPEGAMVSFDSLTGGSGLTTGTRYFVRDVTTDTFKLAASAGGAAVNFTTDITAGKLYRPGLLTGAATTPGLYKLRMVATNGSGASAEVLYVIGIYPAAAEPDANTDLVWDIGERTITRRNAAPPTTTPATPAAIVAPLAIKEGDDCMIRLIIVKNGTVLDLPATDLRAVIKEFEPEGEVETETAWLKVGTGTNTSYLLHLKLEGDEVANALSNYEADDGTGFYGLMEFEMTMSNPEDIGPDELVLSSPTFRAQLERDIADNA